MCGVGGIAGGVQPGDAAVLERMAAAMAHRGPDGEGTWHDEHAGLAFRRLAIIDLDPRSDQPLHLGPLHLVFNGEVYNYRELREELRGLGHAFVTEGDGEVLLHAWAQWGEGALDRLNGMFAFAVWDAERRTLTAACDPFGEKPLFWAEHDGRLLFASDVRALLQAAPELRAPREGALGPYLARGLMPPIDESFFARVRRLPGGHVLRWRAGRATTARWWHPRRVEVPRRYEDAADRLRELLTDSIRLRLRSDVPVGTSLSGGIDSSALVGLAGHLAGDHRRHAFTARFPGFERDEWDYARAVARSAGVLEHHAVEPGAEELLEDLQGLVRAHEEPVASSSVYAQFRVMRAAHEAGVTVLLDGQGADELFGGYEGAEGWALRAEGTGATLHALVHGGRARRAVLLSLGAERGPRALAARHRLRGASPYAATGVAREAARIDPPDVPWASGGGPLRRELARQTFHTSMPALLRYADRNSMAHGREVRLPFLDRRVAELTFSLPAAFLHRDGTRKRILRDAVRDVVPAQVLARRDKVGFETPEASWLATPAALATASDVLLDPGCSSAALLDRDAIAADARGGRWRDPNALWRALNAELWLRELTAAPPSPSRVPAGTGTRT